MVPALTIAEHASGALKQEVLPRVSQGNIIMTWAFQEPDPRLTPEAVQTRAVAEGDEFVITGTKMFVDNFVAAEKCLVACRTSPVSGKDHGLSMFLVDTNAAGISQTALTTLAKDKQSKVDFSGVRVPKSALVGDLDADAAEVHLALLVLCQRR